MLTSKVLRRDGMIGSNQFVLKTNEKNAEIIVKTEKERTLDQNPYIKGPQKRRYDWMNRDD